MNSVNDWYEGDWIQTFSGKKFHVFNPRAEDVCIEDIAHALSLLARYNGHTREFYSVAQHSVLVSMNVSVEHKFWGLMHDAAEAYIGDLVRPMKQHPSLQSVWRQIENAVTTVICHRFDMDTREPPEVKAMDRVLCVTEKRDVLPQDLKADDAGIVPLDTKIYPCSASEAEHLFLGTFSVLSGKRTARK